MTARSNYFERPGLNWSTLKAALVSAKALRHALAHPPTQTDAMRLGSAMHLCVLEPDAYASADGIVRAPDEYVTPSGGLSSSAKAKAWLAEQGDALVVTPGEVELIETRRDAVMAHPTAGAWVRSAIAEGLVEVELEWVEDTIAGPVACKGKLDAIAGPVLLDLKNFSPRGRFDQRAVEGEIMSRDYPAQLAWYLRGLAACGRPVPDAIGWIVVEATAPHDVACVVADDEVLAYGHERAQLALDRYVDALVTGRWDGIAPDGPVTMTLPRWARRDDDADVAGDLGLTGLEVGDE